jgi:hypothetical protein
MLHRLQLPEYSGAWGWHEAARSIVTPQPQGSLPRHGEEIPVAVAIDVHHDDRAGDVGTREDSTRRRQRRVRASGPGTEAGGYVEGIASGRAARGGRRGHTTRALERRGRPQPDDGREPERDERS